MESCPPRPIDGVRVVGEVRSIPMERRSPCPTITLIWYPGDICVSLLSSCSIIVHVPVLYCTLLYSPSCRVGVPLTIIYDTFYATYAMTLSSVVVVEIGCLPRL